LMRNVVPLAHVPFCWSSWMGSPAAESVATGGATWRSGPPASLQWRLISPAARSTVTRACVRPVFIVFTSLQGMLRLCRMSGGKASARTCATTGRSRGALSEASVRRPDVRADVIDGVASLVASLTGISPLQRCCRTSISSCGRGASIHPIDFLRHQHRREH